MHYEIKSTLEGSNSRINGAEERKSVVEDRMVEINKAEKKSSSTHQNTDTSFPNQETLTSHPQGAGSTITRNHKHTAYRKGTPNTAI